ncbi:MAG: protein kinase [Candidatus Binatia bacterium]
MPRNESGQLEPGTLLAGRYRIERFLAGGGMGLVYIAQDQRLADRRCAVKEIFDRFTNPEERARAIEYFHREADTLAQLNHPAIPAIFDRFGEGNCHYLVMDFIEGANLEDELAARDGILPESRVVEIGRELCDVLSYLHSFQPPIIYRDMKPGNVILTPSGRIVLIDFGIARIFNPQGKATLIGTPGFAPPEQYSGSVDQRSDVYALAALMHYTLTGRDPEKNPPFSFPPVHSLKPDASPFLAQAIDAALAYKPEERPESATAFKEMFLYGRGLNAPTIPPAASKSATQPLQPLEVSVSSDIEIAEEMRPRKKRRWGRRVAALFFIGLVGSAAYGVFTHPEVLDVGKVAQWGEQIPWQKVEQWIPASQKESFRQFVANLPWEREKRLRALRADPLELVSLTVVNTSRDGTPLSEPKDTYVDSEVQYLTWDAQLRNRLVGVEGGNYRLEGRFFDPEGGVAGKSEVGRFVRAEEGELHLRGITLLEGVKERAKGDYQLEIYLQDKKLGSETVRIEAEPTKVAKAESVKSGDSGEAMPAMRGAPEPDPAIEERKRRLAEEAKRRAEEEKRVALIQERSKKPLDLLSVRFLNTNKTGKRLSKTTEAFPASEVRFIAWEAQFRNRLADLVPAYHRIEATYYGPNGQPLGTVQDAKQVDPEQKNVTFTARIGNSTGGAFIPGTYRVDFYVNGWPLSSREFSVTDDHPTVAQAPDPSGATRQDQPPQAGGVTNSLAYLFDHHSGSLMGLIAGRESSLEIDFRPQRNGRLQGEILINEPGFGAAPLEGRTDGHKIEFRSPMERGTFHFRGWRDDDRLTGTYTVFPSGAEGRWTVKIGRRPPS